MQITWTMDDYHIVEFDVWMTCLSHYDDFRYSGDRPLGIIIVTGQIFRASTI